MERAAGEHDIDLASSWMVGDILDDVEAGRGAGCRTVLVDSGGETEWRRGPSRTPHAVVNDLAAAARVIALASGNGTVHERRTS
jgi:phosphoglycolate phosphatase-like HAD superfamily hydrolase